MSMQDKYCGMVWDGMEWGEGGCGSLKCVYGSLKCVYGWLKCVYGSLKFRHGSLKCS